MNSIFPTVVPQNDIFASFNKANVYCLGESIKKYLADRRFLVVGIWFLMVDCYYIVSAYLVLVLTYINRYMAELVTSSLKKHDWHFMIRQIG